MNKVFGRKECFVPLREDASRWIVSYDYTEETDGENATWYEVYFYKKTDGKPGIERIRDAIIADIDARTDERILSGYEWTVLHGDEDGSHIGETVNVWLTMENQNNFKEAHRIAGNNASLVIPVKFKISEDAEKYAIYETFNSFEELNAFYLGAFAYVKACLDAGWQKKDAFDRTPYEEALGNSDIQSVSEV